MDKRYQVFISSTFTDLVEERQQVLKAVLELDHMPAGMELFPASDESAWQLIRDVIDGSDYYVLIVGGRYGSNDGEGIGYTEKEYDYAKASGKPVIALLHKHPEGLPREKTETDGAAWEKLRKFRTRVEAGHTCDYWASSGDLKSAVIVAVTQTIKRRPAIGWIRADKVPSEATLADVIALRNRIAELEQERDVGATNPPKGTDELAQGDDEFDVRYSFTARLLTERYADDTDVSYNATVSPTWNALFARVAPLMINEETDYAVRKGIASFLTSAAKADLRKQKKILKDRQPVDFKFSAADVETAVVQLRALGLIEHSLRSRSVKDTSTYWRLTAYGDTLMTRLRAIRRDRATEEQDGDVAEDE